jgi:hypothetical protein
MLAATQKEIERVSQYMRRLSSRNAVVGMMHSPSGGVERDSSPAASRLLRASACGSLQHDTWEPPVRNIGIYFWAGRVYGNSRPFSLLLAPGCQPGYLGRGNPAKPRE